MIKCQVEGLPELSKRLGVVVQNVPKAFLKGALVTARRCVKFAKVNVPVKTGAGKRSIRARMSSRYKTVYLMAGEKRKATTRRGPEDAYYIAFHDQGTVSEDGAQHVPATRYFTEAADRAPTYLVEDVMGVYAKMSIDQVMSDNDIIAGTGTDE